MNINDQISNIINNYYLDKIYDNSNNISIKKEILNKLMLNERELFENITNEELLNIYNIIDNKIFDIQKKLYIKKCDSDVNIKYVELYNAYNRLQKYFNIDNIVYNDTIKRDEFINYMICYSMDNSNEELQKLLYLYFKYENEIMQRKLKEEENIAAYETSLDNIKKANNLSETDIHNYFKCVKEAIISYNEKNLGVDYNFNSNDINNSIHAGLDLDLSVTKGQLPHLLGLANPSYDQENSDKSVYILLYNKYLKERNLLHSDENYLLYIYMYLENDLIKYLKTNIKDKKKIQKTIIKSFDKSINFISIYEYKKIPEIILDYDIRKTYSVSVEDSKTSAKYLPNEQTFPEDRSKDLITKAMQNITLNSKVTIEKLVNQGYNFTAQEKKFIDLVKKQFTNIDDVNLSIKDGKIDTNYMEYQDNIYMINNEKFWLQLQPNIFIVSYNSKKYNKKAKELDKYTNEAFLIMCALLKKELNIKKTNTNVSLNINQQTFNNIKRNHLINIDYIIYAICDMSDKEMEKMLLYKDIIHDKENLEDYNLLKKYIRDAFDEKLSSQINSSFGITNNVSDNKDNYSLIEEPPLLRIIPKITRNLLEKKGIKELLEKDVRIIGFATTRNEDEKVAVDYIPDEKIKKIPTRLLQKLYQNKGKFKEKFAKTFMAKTILQLKYDLEINGWAYKLDFISTTTSEKEVIYYNCKMFIDNQKYSEQLKRFFLNYKNNLENNKDFTR